MKTASAWRIRVEISKGVATSSFGWPRTTTRGTQIRMGNVSCAPGIAEASRPV